MVYDEIPITEWVPFVVPIVIAMMVAFLVMGLTSRIRRRIGERHPSSLKEINLVAKLLRNVILLIIAMTLLEVLDVPLGNVWTAVSTLLAMVAIGFFAVWSLLSHMTAYVVLFLQRPFRQGEYLQLGDESYSGRVIGTGLFFTTVEDADGGRSQIPNNMLFQKRFRLTREPVPVPEKDSA